MTEHDAQSSYEQIVKRNRMLHGAATRLSEEKKRVEQKLEETKAKLQELKTELVEKGSSLATAQHHSSLVERRCNQLQLELKELKEKNKGGWGFGWGSGKEKEALAQLQQEQEVLKEELESKIQENEDLHVQLFETRQQFGNKVFKGQLEIDMKVEEVNQLHTKVAEVETHIHHALVEEAKLVQQVAALREEVIKLQEVKCNNTADLHSQILHWSHQIQKEGIGGNSTSVGSSGEGAGVVPSCNSLNTEGSSSSSVVDNLSCSSLNSSISSLAQLGIGGSTTISVGGVGKIDMSMMDRKLLYLADDGFTLLKDLVADVTKILRTSAKEGLQSVTWHSGNYFDPFDNLPMSNLQAQTLVEKAISLFDINAPLQTHATSHHHHQQQQHTTTRHHNAITASTLLRNSLGVSSGNSCSNNGSPSNMMSSHPHTSSSSNSNGIISTKLFCDAHHSSSMFANELPMSPTNWKEQQELYLSLIRQVDTNAVQLKIEYNQVVLELEEAHQQIERLKTEIRHNAKQLEDMQNEALATKNAYETQIQMLSNQLTEINVGFDQKKKKK